MFVQIDSKNDFNKIVARVEKDYDAGVLQKITEVAAGRNKNLKLSDVDISFIATNSTGSRSFP